MPNNVALELLNLVNPPLSPAKALVVARLVFALSGASLAWRYSYGRREGQYFFCSMDLWTTYNAHIY